MSFNLFQLILVAALAVLASSSVEGGHHKHKKIIIHVPYIINLKHHTHTITKHIIHKEHKKEEPKKEEPKKEKKPKKEEYHEVKGYSHGKHHHKSKKVEEKNDPHRFSTYDADFSNQFHEGLPHQITSYGNLNFKGHKDTKLY